MKKLYNLLSYGVAICFFALIVSSCEKVDQLPNYAPGTATTLNASANTLAPAVTDSNKTVLTLSWSSPSYSVDSNTVKYIVQLDSAGRNFSKQKKKSLRVAVLLLSQPRKSMPLHLDSDLHSTSSTAWS